MRAAAAGIIVLLGLFAVAVQADYAPEPNDVEYYKWSKVKDTPIGGVYPPCRQYWIRHAQERQFAVQNKRCPFGPFAADIVNHNIHDPSNVHIDGFDCGKWVEGNSGARGASQDPTKHGEMEAIRRLMDCSLHPELCDSAGNQLHAQDKAMFANLTMYSTGESCEMDAAAEVLAGFGEVVFGVYTSVYMRAGWQLPNVSSKRVYETTLTPTRPLRVIEGVDADILNHYYIWQYDPAYPCPEGCARSADGATCVKDSTQTIVPNYLLTLGYN